MSAPVNTTLPDEAIEDAIEARLRAHASTRGKYAFYGPDTPVPPEPEYPYIELVGVVSTPIDTTNTAGDESVVIMRVVSRKPRGIAGGNREVNQIASALTDALTSSLLVLAANSGHTCFGMTRDSRGAPLSRDSSQFTFREKTLNFRIWTQYTG